MVASSPRGDMPGQVVGPEGAAAPDSARHDPPGARLSPLIRAARGDDLRALAEIERLSFSDPWSAEAFQVALEREQVRLTVAEVTAPEGGGGEGRSDTTVPAVAGFLLAWFVADEGEIANVAVHPDWRGRGVGSALLDDVLAAARARATAAVYLEVRASNDTAQALYASRGFEQVGRRRRYYSRPVEDAIVLRWEGLGPGRGS